MMVQSWLERAVASGGETCALQGTQGELSHSELLARARAGARWLSQQGITSGQQVAIALAPDLPFAIALHACMLLGAVAVPVDLRMSQAERERITADAAIVLEEPLPELSTTEGAIEQTQHELRGTLAIIHTSGTTSVPKPIELTYGNFLWSAIGSAVALGSDSKERWLCALPLSHVGGLSILIRSVIYQSTAIVHERFDTERVLRALTEEKITLVSLVATTLARLLDAGLENPPTLRCALTGGGPIPGGLLMRARAAGVQVSQTYGLTETCSQATTMPLRAPAALTEGAGPALFCTRIQIAPNGEVLVAGPTVAAASLDPDGWLHTGDEGHLDQHGALHITGRKADTIVSGGENVAPAEVEAILESHPYVLEAAVVGRADDQWGEAVTAIVVAREGKAADTRELLAHCAMHLAPYKVPKQVILRSNPLPRTASGKLLRRELTTEQPR